MMSYYLLVWHVMGLDALTNIIKVTTKTYGKLYVRTYYLLNMFTPIEYYCNGDIVTCIIKLYGFMSIYFFGDKGFHILICLLINFMASRSVCVNMSGNCICDGDFGPLEYKQCFIGP